MKPRREGTCTAVNPRYSFWSNPAGAWVVRGGTGVNIPVDDSTAQTTFNAGLAIGRYFRPHDVPFGDLVFYVNCNVTVPLEDDGDPTVGVGPGTRFQIGGNWYFLNYWEFQVGRRQAVRLPGAGRHREGVVIPKPFCLHQDRISTAVSWRITSVSARMLGRALPLRQRGFLCAGDYTEKLRIEPGKQALDLRICSRATSAPIAASSFALMKSARSPITSGSLLARHTLSSFRVWFGTNRRSRSECERSPHGRSERVNAARRKRQIENVLNWFGPRGIGCKGAAIAFFGFAL